MTTPATNPPDAIVLARDLMFTGRISAEARAAGVTLRMLRAPADLASVAGRFLIVDLNLDGAIDAAAEWRRRTGGHVTGFVAHVDADTVRLARAAGIDNVMARGQFVQRLPSLLRRGSVDSPGVDPGHTRQP